jgi:hypothetical protein
MPRMILALAVIMIGSTAVFADDPLRPGLTSVPQAEQRRPCGPGTRRNLIRLFIPQGFAGADFKPACRQHDNCYELKGADKAACDAAMYAQMLCACENSRRPRLCRLTARIMYRSVQSPFAETVFQRDQK